MLIILSVLGSIFFGIASPTEAAGIGAFMTTILAIIEKKLSIKTLQSILRKTTNLTSMIFMILIGATAFSLVFRGLHGERLFSGYNTIK